jgi:hypothetical protein
MNFFLFVFISLGLAKTTTKSSTFTLIKQIGAQVAGPEGRIGLYQHNLDSKSAVGSEARSLPIKYHHTALGAAGKDWKAKRPLLFQVHTEISWLIL